ncbi:MAG: isoprenylcysteine carboxylmethyltransferase family protein [Pseudomonadota bacterium]
MHLRVPPPAVFAICAALIFLIDTLLPFFSVGFPGQIVLTLLLVAAGVLTGAQAVLSFLHNKTTVDPREPKTTTALVTGGVYRFTRNPMYLGLLCLLLATSVYSGTLAAVIIVPAFIWYLTEFQIKPEEAALQSNFGETYESYRKRVRRWI